MVSKRLFTIITIPVIAIGLFSLKPCNYWYRRNLVESHSIGRGLYVETFCYENWGVHGGESFSYYLTDSNHLTKLIGLTDEKKFFDVQIVGDKILVRKWRHESILAPKPKVLDSFYLDIHTLE